MSDPFTTRRRAAADRVLRLVGHFLDRAFAENGMSKEAADRLDRAHDLWRRTLGNYDQPIGPAHRLP
ncbi:hypothetical protein [Azospirillum sp. TSA6c]|uniref:hypothetical protein n=1 Tax=Azospirillum sp. TSA6c TaxID=709813 RepID=UPI0011B3E8BF|nr:hypothetical protein [Azospirillum sp. TSA6c]